jgi:hypothetical protein
MDLSKMMPEAEVSLRVAIFLIRKGLAAEDVQVAIDGAQVKTTQMIHFAIAEFLRDSDWSKSTAEGRWQGEYSNSRYCKKIIIHSNPGQGDVYAPLTSGRVLRVECKKGPLSRSKSSQEYPLLREALGQLLTVAEVGENDLLAVAVPESPKFTELAGRWRRAPLIDRFGICILTVGRDGIVQGLP